MKTSYYFLAAALLTASLTKPCNLEAAPSIASIDMRRCFEQSKEGMKAKEMIDTLSGQMQEKLSEIEGKMKELSTQLSNEEYRQSLSKDALDEMEKQFENLLQEREAKHGEFSQELNQTQMFLTENLIQNISKGAEVIAKEKSIAMILQKEAVVYSDESTDLTDLVLAYADKEFEKSEKK